MAKLTCIPLSMGHSLFRDKVSLPGLDGILISLPFGRVQGCDVWSFFACEGSEYAKVVLADVTGHGSSCPSQAGLLEKLLANHGDEINPRLLLDSLNDELLRSASGVHATGLAAVFHVSTSKLDFAYAGFPPILRLRRSSGEVLRLRHRPDHTCGLPLGMIEGSPYHNEGTMLRHEDILIFHSDGLNELKAWDRREWLGLQGVEELVRDASRGLETDSPLSDLAASILDKIRSFHGEGDFSDDVTLLLLAPESRGSRWVAREA